MPASIERGSGSGKGKAVMLLVIILIGGLTFALLSGKPSQVDSASDLLAQAEIAVGKITSESFTFDGAVEADSPFNYFTIATTGDGKIDSLNKRMHLKLNLANPQAPSAPGLSIESYTVSDVIYTNVDGTWIRYNATPDLWGQAHFAQKLVYLAKKFDSSLAKKEVVNGRNTFKVAVTPTMQELMELVGTMDPGLMKQSGIDLSNVGKGVDRGVRSILITIWIDEREYLPVKADFLLEVGSQMLNPSGTGVMPVDVTISVSVNFDFKTPFNVVLPAAANSAVPI